MLVVALVSGVVLEGRSPATADPDPPPSIVSFVADAGEITVPGDTFVRATADRSPYNTYYSIHIVDDDAPGTSWACGSSAECGMKVSAPWSVNSDPKPRRFHAEIRNWSTGAVISQSGQITIDVKPFDWDVTLAADKSSITVPNSTTVRATANQHPSGTGYAIRIVDEDGETTDSVCGNIQTCTKNVYAPWSINANPTPRRFHAVIKDSTTGHVAAKSETVTVDRQPFDWDVTLAADKSSITVPNSTTVRATANEHPSGTGYAIRIVDEDGETTDSVCGNIQTCTKNVYAPWSINPNPTPRRFHAEIKDSTTGHLAAKSDPVVVDRRRFIFSPTVTFSSQTDSKGNTVHKATSGLAASDPSLYGTGYSIKIMRADGAQMCSAPQVGCNATVTVGGTYRTIVQNSGGHIAGQSAAWTLTGSGPVEETSEGIDLVGLAGLLGPSSVCDRVLVSPYGTHASGSSVSDQYLACEAAVGQGKGTLDILKAIAAVGGSAGVLWWLQSDAQRTTPAPGSPTTEEDAEAPRPVPAPLLPSVDDLASELAELNPGLAQGDADAIAHQCLFLTGRIGINGHDRCTERRIFASGTDVAGATTHDLEALAQYPLWVQLNYEMGSTKPGQGWQSCPDKVQGQQCDEYPFFATEQGGPLAIPTPHLKAIDADDNQLQGSRYNSFRLACGLQTGTPDPTGNGNSTGGTPFLGIPIPPDWGIPTMALCNGLS